MQDCGQASFSCDLRLDVEYSLFIRSWWTETLTSTPMLSTTSLAVASDCRLQGGTTVLRVCSGMRMPAFPAASSSNRAQPEMP